MELADFKDKHLGKRCFVLGCGGSLEHENLDLIADEISFGMNNIVLIYPFTKWRPTYYYNSTKQVERLPHWLNCANEIVRDGTISFVRKGSSIMDAPNVMRYRYQYLKSDEDQVYVAWSKDPTNIIVHFKMSLYGLMQLVAYMGFGKVYLLGFDNDFKVGHNHFVDEYEGGFAWTEEVVKKERYWQGKAHRYIKSYTDALGIQVYNCSMNSLVTCWPKINLEEVINKRMLCGTGKHTLADILETC